MLEGIIEKEDKPKQKPGKPWETVGRFLSFEEAEDKRNQLLQTWERDNIRGMQAKIRRTNSPIGFVVKARLHPDFEPKKEVKKKNAKSRKNSKKNTKQPKFEIDPPSV